MKITSISYKRIFPIAQYINETIGVEVQVQEGEDIDLAYGEARAIVGRWHYEYNATVYRKDDPVPPTIDPPHVDDVPKRICDMNMDELAKIKKTLPPSLLPDYMKRMKELTPKTV